MPMLVPTLSVCPSSTNGSMRACLKCASRRSRPRRPRLMFPSPLHRDVIDLRASAALYQRKLRLARLVARSHIRCLHLVVGSMMV